MKRIATQSIGPITCCVIGLIALSLSHPSFGQSVPTPPKKSAEMIKLENLIAEKMNFQLEIEQSISDVSKRIQLLSTELDSLRKQESQMSVSAESYSEVLKTLHSQRFQLLIDLAGIDARHEAIEKAIAELTRQQADSLVNPLQKLVEIRAKDIERLRMMMEQGAISTDNFRDAEIALLEAKTRLAQVNSTSGGALGQLNSQLLNTSLEKTEKAARLAKTSSLIEEVDEYRTHASKVSDKQQELNHLSVSIRSLQDELETVKKVISSQSAYLETLSGKKQ
jgi:chromosome segregation ATPase